jgi:hypothetical protein
MRGFFFMRHRRWGSVTTSPPACGPTIEGLRVSAGIHRVHYGDYHRLLSKVFPYGIFYTVDREGAVVWAVIDLRKDPAWIEQKLQE